MNAFLAREKWGWIGPTTITMVLTGWLLLWLVGGSANAEEFFQTSPFDSPPANPTATVVNTPTDTPTHTPEPTTPPEPTPTATITVVSTVDVTVDVTATVTITPTSVITSTPVPALQPPGPADPTAIPTATPTVSLAEMLMPLAIPSPRPVTVPTPVPTPDRLWLAATMVDGAVASLAWLWMLCGSFIFFVVAGVVVGLGISGRIVHRRRMGIYGDNAFLNTFLPGPGYPQAGVDSWPDPARNQSPDWTRPAGDDDNWPASLP